MKRFLLISLFAISGLSTFSQSFVQGNLAVFRVGSGVGALSNATVGTFIDEYDLTGVRVRTITVPTTTAGSTLRLTTIPKGTASATAIYNQEGMGGLSQNGNYLAVFGHDQALGQFATGSTAKVIGVIAADGSIGTTTSNTFTGSTTARAVVANNDGNSFYSSALNNGVHYSTLGSVAANVQINITPSNVRSLTVFNNKLYVVIGTQQIYIYNTLPTTAASPILVNLPSGSTANQIALFDTDGDGEANIMYTADDGSDNTNYGNSSLRKYALVSGTWTDKGSVKIVGTTDGLKSITGKVINTTTVELYAATWGNPATSVASKILKITDANATTSTISAAGNIPVVLKDADANTFFRSVSFAPGTTPLVVLPIKLSSFTIKKQNNGALLSWSTASETNNSHFEILRSQNGKSFTKIGELKGKGNSTIAQSYSFTDLYPFSGTNYYKLRQVDFDGNAEEFNVISVKIDLGKKEYSVWTGDDNQVHISVYAAVASQGTVRITDVAGRSILTQKVQLNQGYTLIDLPVNLKTGIYLSTVNMGTQNLTEKFIK